MLTYTLLNCFTYFQKKVFFEVLKSRISCQIMTPTNYDEMVPALIKRSTCRMTDVWICVSSRQKDIETPQVREKQFQLKNKHEALIYSFFSECISPQRH